MDKNITDFIISKKNNEILGFVNVSKDTEIPFLYTGRILDNNFPKELIFILEEYVNTVNDLTFSILDEIEEEINSYNLYLKDRNIKIFLPFIDKNKQEISFYIKYPSGTGFHDDIFL